jgi:CRP-like cAMP-binding protein
VTQLRDVVQRRPGKLLGELPVAKRATAAYRTSSRATPRDRAPSLRAVPFNQSEGQGHVQLLSRPQQTQLTNLSTRVRVPSRTILYSEATAAAAVYLVSEGVIKTFRDLPSGKRRVLAFLFPQDLFGLAEDGLYVNTAQSVTAVTLYRLQAKELTEALLRDAELDHQFLMKVTHELRKSQRQIIAVGRRDAIGRVAMFLDMLENQTPRSTTRSDVVRIPMSRSDIANYLGMSLEAVSRASKALERSGIIAFSGRHAARVLDRARFDALVAAM